MVNLVNREAPGWTKRLRLRNAPPDRTLCASWMSALEQSIRKFDEELTKSVIKPEIGTSFDSLVSHTTSTACIHEKLDSILDMGKAD